MKKIKFIIIIIIIFIIFGIFYHNQMKDNEGNTTKYTDLIDNIIAYDADPLFNQEFLNWIYDKYGMDTLEKLNNLVENKTYDKNIWHNSIAELTDLSEILPFLIHGNKHNNINDTKTIKNLSKD